jgi:hypothetical protein
MPYCSDHKLDNDEREKNAYDKRYIAAQATEQCGRLRENVGREIRGKLDGGRLRESESRKKCER